MALESNYEDGTNHQTDYATFFFIVLHPPLLHDPGQGQKFEKNTFNGLMLYKNVSFKSLFIKLGDFSSLSLSYKFTPKMVQIDLIAPNWPFVTLLLMLYLKDSQSNMCSTEFKIFWWKLYKFETKLIEIGFIIKKKSIISSIKNR